MPRAFFWIPVRFDEWIRSWQSARRATQVVVSAGAAVINTESATISATFSATQNDRSPLVNIYPSNLSRY